MVVVTKSTVSIITAQAGAQSRMACGQFPATVNGSFQLREGNVSSS